MKEFNFETLKKLIKLVEKRIRSINESIASSDEQIEKVDEFDWDSIINFGKGVL